jgi:hypothetical protein
VEVVEEAIVKRRLWESHVYVVVPFAVPYAVRFPVLS